MWKVIFSTKSGTVLKTYTFDNVYAAEDCFFKHMNLHSVRSGYNAVKIEPLNKGGAK